LPKDWEITLFDLASGGVYHASCITTEAVGSYPAFSPLLRKKRSGIFSVALSIPGFLQNRDPGVTRHPVLRSSDFPPPVKDEKQLPELNCTFFLKFYYTI